MKRIVLVAAVAACVGAPAAASAQGGPGFLFQRPKVSFAVKGGYSLPNAGSDLFDFSREQFTLSRGDFASPYLGGELAVRVAPRWDAALNVGWARSRSLSEYRDWVDNNNLPIEQETTFETVTASLGARYYLNDRGRQIGRFAWVPERLSPFVGGGVGLVWYDFTQVGDFVDFQTLDVFPDHLQTEGTAAIVHASAGADLSLGSRVVLTGEGRYQYARDEVRGAFDGFGKIDLSGFQFILGLGIRL